MLVCPVKKNIKSFHSKKIIIVNVQAGISFQASSVFHNKTNTKEQQNYKKVDTWEVSHFNKSI